jgi:hypothetical protein
MEHSRHFLFVADIQGIEELAMDYNSQHTMGSDGRYFSYIYCTPIIGVVKPPILTNWQTAGDGNACLYSYHSYQMVAS